MSFALVRRREVWWPTWRGWLLAVLLSGLLGVGAAVAVALSIYPFLAPVAPARGPDGQGARTLVVEGWLEPPTLAHVVDVLRSGRYERIVTTGGPIDPWFDPRGYGNFAARTAALLQADRGIALPIVAVPAPESDKERTYQSALAVREWGERRGLALPALDVFTADVHARRSRGVYRLAFGPGTEIGVIADRLGRADGERLSGARWWDSSASAKRVLGEAIGWAWTECCFWPEPVAAVPREAAAGAIKAP